MLNWFARRLAETGKEVRKDQRGFTLIELLVVVIIIGILAAIAIPTFLAQRDNAQESTMESDLRNWAAAATACYADNSGSYDTCTKTELAGTPYNAVESDGVTVTVTANADDVWTAEATHAELAGTTATYTTDPASADSGQVVVSP